MSKIKNISENTPFLMPDITGDNFVPDLVTNDFSVGDVVCQSDLYSEFIKRFGSYENGQQIYWLCRNLINDGGYWDYDIDDFRAPYLDVDVFLEEEVVDNGLFSPCIEKWDPGKKYYVGDMVYYSIDGTDKNMIPYRLKIGNRTPNNEPIYELVKIPYEIYEAYCEIYDDYYDRSALVEINHEYYIKLETYSGYYDEKKRLIYFDELDENGNLTFKHWEKATLTIDLVDTGLRVKKISGNGLYWIDVYGNVGASNIVNGTVITIKGNEYIVTGFRAGTLRVEGNTMANVEEWDIIYQKVGNYGSPSKTELSFQTESMLLNLKRKKTSIDDSGNVLPFIIHYDNGTLSTTETECLYMPGITNVKINENGVVTCDYIRTITFSGDTDEQIITVSEPIVIDDSFSTYTNIIIEYYIGAELNKYGEPETYTGIKYVENRSFTLETMDTTIDGIQCANLPYLNIADNYSYAKDENEDLANSGHGASLADIELYEQQIGKTEFDNVGIFKDETLNNVQDLGNEIDANIDRGIATSFERHNVLGEIKTMQDLEHYRNDYFDISKQ